MAGDDSRMAGGESRMAGGEPCMTGDCIHTCMPYIYGLVALLDSTIKLL